MRLDEVAALVLAASPVGRRSLVAIDGVGGSGKTTFAARLASTIDSRPVVVLHVDDFFQPSAVRHARGRYSPEGFWLDTYNYDALVAWALVPLAAGEPFRSSSFDASGDLVVRPSLVDAPADAVVLVEGTFLHRDELAGFWDFSMFLDVPFDEAARRMAQRGGIDDRLRSRYEGAQQIYLTSVGPKERATLVVDDVGGP